MAKPAYEASFEAASSLSMPQKTNHDIAHGKVKDVIGAEIVQNLKEKPEEEPTSKIAEKRMTLEMYTKPVFFCAQCLAARHAASKEPCPPYYQHNLAVGLSAGDAVVDVKAVRSTSDLEVTPLWCACGCCAKGNRWTDNCRTEPEQQSSADRSESRPNHASSYMVTATYDAISPSTRQARGVDLSHDDHHISGSMPIGFPPAPFPFICPSPHGEDDARRARFGLPPGRRTSPTKGRWSTPDARRLQGPAGPTTPGSRGRPSYQASSASSRFSGDRTDRKGLSSQKAQPTGNTRKRPRSPSPEPEARPRRQVMRERGRSRSAERGRKPASDRRSRSPDRKKARRGASPDRGRHWQGKSRVDDERRERAGWERGRNQNGRSSNDRTHRPFGTFRRSSRSPSRSLSPPRPLSPYRRPTGPMSRRSPSPYGRRPAHPSDTCHHGRRDRDDQRNRY